MVEVNNCYIYAHYKTNINEIFYIGKGTYVYSGNKYRRAYTKNNRGKHWNNIIDKYGYYVEILFDNLTEKESLEKEIELITKYGRLDLTNGPLINKTIGGENGCDIGRSVSQYSKSGKFIKKFKSINECSRESEINSSLINDCCSGKQKTSNNFIFRYSEDSFDKYDIIDNRTKSICQYSLDGKFIKEHKSAKEASIELNLFSNHITNCCNGKANSVKGFIFRYKYDPFDKFKYKTCEKIVLQFSMSMEFIKEHKSIKSASKELNINNSCISSCCVGRQKTSGGYIFKYKEYK